MLARVHPLIYDIFMTTNKLTLSKLQINEVKTNVENKNTKTTSVIL